jgi:hypothetical protein
MRSALAVGLSSLLFASSALGGVSDLLLKAPAVTLVGGLSPQNGNYTGPAVVQRIVYRSASNAARAGSFSVAPTVGNLLVAQCSNTNLPVDATAATGWTADTSFGSPNIRGVLIVYKYVTTPSVTSYTPCTNPATGTDVSTAIAEVSGANSVWATAHQGTTNANASSTGPAVDTETTTADNTLALGFGYVDTSGGSTMNNLNFSGGNVATNAIDDGGVASNAMSGFAYGQFRYMGAASILSVVGNWSGGAGASRTGAVTVRLNP